MLSALKKLAPHSVALKKMAKHGVNWHFSPPPKSRARLFTMETSGHFEFHAKTNKPIERKDFTKQSKI